MDQPIVRFVHQTTESHLGDCSIASLAMLLGIAYAEALVLIAPVCRTVLREGANWAELKRAARRHRPRVKLIEQRGFSIEDESEDSGILGVESKETGKQHAVYFKRGLIFDGATGNVWDADVYLNTQNYRPLTLLSIKRPL